LSMTEFALDAVLRDWSVFAGDGIPLRLSMNVPISALVKLPMASFVRDRRPTNTSWPGLIFEVTEREILQDIPLAHEIATQLRIYGVDLAIDDFGAGCSSLTHLRELPFVELKLDRSFVTGCANNETNAKLCQTVIEL